MVHRDHGSVTMSVCVCECCVCECESVCVCKRAYLCAYMCLCVCGGGGSRFMHNRLVYWRIFLGAIVVLTPLHRPGSSVSKWCAHFCVIIGCDAAHGAMLPWPPHPPRADFPESILKPPKKVRCDSFLLGLASLGLARTIYVRCIYGISGREITK